MLVEVYSFSFKLVALLVVWLFVILLMLALLYRSVDCDLSCLIVVTCCLFMDIVFVVLWFFVVCVLRWCLLVGVGLCCCCIWCVVGSVLSDLFVCGWFTFWV